MDKKLLVDRPVFVTGGTGYWGSWSSEVGLSHKSDVVCLVRDLVPQSELSREPYRKGEGCSG